ncbi:MAG: succinate dehydrogenase, cytochrome b556 subunit [Rhodospirillales bacterium]|nr:succinate dehydrogenase, cytochrome b556 subunit [Rhodospirillales bacterium]
MQIYRWQWTMALSIFHRGTGLALAAGTLLLVWWLVAAAAGPEAFTVVQGFIGSFIGHLLLFGWSVAFFYHLCNGIRHLIWDSGKMLELVPAYRSAIAVLLGTGTLTLLAWIVGLAIA